MLDYIWGQDWLECLAALLLVHVVVVKVALVIMLIGGVIGLCVWGISPETANRTAEVLVIIMIVSLRVWHWMFEQGGAFWFFGVLSFFLVMPCLVLSLSLTFSMATVAIVRDGTDIWPRIKRLVMAFALLPLMYVVVFRSGFWPSRLSESSMTMHFLRNRSAFEHARATFEERRGVNCPPDCIRHTDQGSASDLEKVALFMVAGVDSGRLSKDGAIYFPYWAIGLYRDEDAKGYVYATNPPSPLVDDLDATTVEKPGYQAFYKHITGNWYLRHWSE